MKKRISDIDVIPGKRFKKNEIPIFDEEELAAQVHGFTESEHKNCLCYEKDDVMVVRYQDPQGIDPGNCIYHVYKKEIGADGNFTGNAKAIESINGNAMSHTLAEAFAKAKLHKRVKP